VLLLPQATHTKEVALPTYAEVVLQIFTQAVPFHLRYAWQTQAFPVENPVDFRSLEQTKHPPVIGTAVVELQRH
jgi:nicotinamide riboside transporter PnuC